MITITLKDKSIKRFNMPTFKREREFRGAWYAMYADPGYSGKSFKINTKDGVIMIKISDIVECNVDESIFCEGAVH